MAVTENAVLQIKEMILDGRLKAGDRLPKEQVLSEQLGISRGSLREAVKSLAAVNVLSVRQGDGTYVTSLDPALLLEAVSFMMDAQSTSALIELFEVRSMLEPAATEIAAVRMSDASIARLTEKLEAVATSTTIEELVEHDSEFHQEIIAAAGNSYLSGLLESLSSRTLRARIWRGLTQHEAVERTLAEHHAIVEAIKDRNPPLARARAYLHVQGVEEWLRVHGRLATSSADD